MAAAGYVMQPTPAAAETPVVAGAAPAPVTTPFLADNTLNLAGGLSDDGRPSPRRGASSSNSRPAYSRCSSKSASLRRRRGSDENRRLGSSKERRRREKQRTPRPSRKGRRKHGRASSTPRGRSRGSRQTRAPAEDERDLRRRPSPIRARSRSETQLPPDPQRPAASQGAGAAGSQEAGSGPPALLTSAMNEEAANRQRGRPRVETRVLALTVPSVTSRSAPWVSTLSQMDAIDLQLTKGMFILAWVQMQPELPRLPNPSVALFYVLDRQERNRDGVDVEVRLLAARAKPLLDAIEKRPLS